MRQSAPTAPKSQRRAVRSSRLQSPKSTTTLKPVGGAQCGPQQPALEEVASTLGLGPPEEGDHPLVGGEAQRSQVFLEVAGAGGLAGAGRAQHDHAAEHDQPARQGLFASLLDDLDQSAS